MFRLSARTAVTIAFAMDGAVYGSWAARVPALGEQVGSGPAGLGLALLGPAVAMVLTTSPAGWACARWGARRVVVCCLAAACLVLPLVGLAGSVWMLGLTLAVLGGLMGAVDVGVNVAAVAVVRALDRPLMPLFHAGFSFGGLVGAAGAAIAASLAVSPQGQFRLVAIVGLVTVAVCCRRIPGTAAPARTRVPGSYREVVARPRLWLLAAVALCAAVAEGACAEWSAVFLVDQRGASEAAATAGYAAFTLTIAVTRLTGERAERALGSYRVLVAGGLLAACGVLLAAVVPFGATGYAGFAIAGIGLAFCFPIALGLAGGTGRQEGAAGRPGAAERDDTAEQGDTAGRPGDAGHGERELGFVTTVAYAGLLGGPPAIGTVADLASLTVAMAMIGLVAALIAPAALAARSLAARERGRRGRAEPTAAESTAENPATSPTGPAAATEHPRTKA